MSPPARSWNPRRKCAFFNNGYEGLDYLEYTGGILLADGFIAAYK